MGNASATTSSVNAPSLPVPETSSSCLTQTVTAAHNFEVLNFSLLQGIGVGKSVSSSTFTVGGYGWSIELYPDGNRDEHAGRVSAYLRPRGARQTSVRVRFSFGVILGKRGTLSKPKFHEVTFEPTSSSGFGWPKLVDKSSLQKLLRDGNDGDRFTVRCVLTVVKDPLVQDVCAVVVPEPSVVRDLAGMLRSGEGADVTFAVGGRAFPAHRCVLAARSAVFRAELLGPMRENREGSVRVDDMEPSIFQALLHFVYTDSLPDDDGDTAGDKDKNLQMQHLLVAADRYGLDRLRLMCEAKLCSSIDAETVATTLALAEQHHCVQLKNACLGFIASRGVLGAVMQSSGFYHLAASCPLLMLEILDKLASLGT